MIGQYLGQSCRLVQAQTQTQTLTQDQRQELEQSLVQRQEVAVEWIRDRVFGPPEELFERVINLLVSNVDDPQARLAIKSVLDDSDLQKRIIEGCKGFLVFNRKMIKRMALEYLFYKQDGKFVFTEDNPDSDDGPKQYVLETPHGRFMEAFENPERLRQEYNSLKDYLNDGTKDRDLSGSLQDLREMRSAIRVSEMIAGTVRAMELALGYAFIIKGSDGVSILPDFLRELAVLERLNFVLSERIQKRFAARFVRVTRRSSSEQFRDAFVNTIGEYVLVSMGIISPEVFTTRRAYLDPEQWSMLSASLTEGGMNLEELIQHYGLKSSGTIFWNRWKVIGRRPSLVTDERIRSFITETVRADADEILDVVDYEMVFEAIRDIVSRSRRVKEKKDTKLEIRDVLITVLTKTKVGIRLVDLIKTKWYKQLDVFYA